MEANTPAEERVEDFGWKEKERNKEEKRRGRDHKDGIPKWLFHLNNNNNKIAAQRQMAGWSLFRRNKGKMNEKFK